MSKIKYFQLAFKNTECKKLVSPNQEKIDSLTTDSWTLFGYDSETDVPTNPILDNGVVREMTEAEISASIAAAEVTRQAAKSDNLKQAENAFLAVIESIPTSVGIAAGDNSASIKIKLLAYYIEDKTTALEIAVDLLNAIHEVEINGGAWSDLPDVPHRFCQKFDEK